MAESVVIIIRASKWTFGFNTYIVEKTGSEKSSDLSKVTQQNSNPRRTAEQKTRPWVSMSFDHRSGGGGLCSYLQSTLLGKHSLLPVGLTDTAFSGDPVAKGAWQGSDHSPIWNLGLFPAPASLWLASGRCPGEALRFPSCPWLCLSGPFQARNHPEKAVRPGNSCLAPLEWLRCGAWWGPS